MVEVELGQSGLLDLQSAPPRRWSPGGGGGRCLRALGPRAVLANCWQQVWGMQPMTAVRFSTFPRTQPPQPFVAEVVRIFEKHDASIGEGEFPAEEVCECAWEGRRAVPDNNDAD